MITSQDITTRAYPILHALTGSSRKEETDITEILDWQLSVLMSQKLPKNPFSYRSLLPSFEIDLSSVHPHFDPMSETYVTEVLSEEDIINGMLEHDFIVRMPPKRRYAIKLEVKSIKKAEPRFVEPERI